MDYLKVRKQDALNFVVIKGATSYQTIALERRCSVLPDVASSTSISMPLNETTDHTAINLENLYRITDFVLVMCAMLFILSSIAYGVIWIYGIAHAHSDIRMFWDFGMVWDEKFH